MAKQYFRISDFSGGWNPDQSPVLLQDNEAQALENFRLDRTGSLVARNGTRNWVVIPGSTENTADVQYGIGRWDHPTNPGLNEVFTARGRTFYKVSPETEEYTGIVDTGGSLAGGQFNTYRNVMYYAAPQQRPWAYDGTETYQLGVASPSASPTFSYVVGGDWTGAGGTYQYAYSFLDTSAQFGQPHETDPSPLRKVTISAAETNKVRITASTNTPTRMTHVRFYRTQADGATLLFLADVPITVWGSSVSYDDPGAATILAPLSPTYNNGLPPSGANRIAFYGGYAFLAKGRELHWSKPEDFDSWPFDQYAEIPFTGSDEITALVPFQDSLLIFGRRNLHILTGQAGQWSVSALSTSLGTPSYKSVSQAEGYLIFLSREGLISYPGLEPYAPRLSRHFRSMPYTMIQQAALAHVPEEQALWVSFPDETITVHLGSQAAGVYTFGVLQHLPGGRTGTEAPLFIQQAKGYVKEYAGTTDFGQPISVRWQSKEFQLDNPEFTKFFRRVSSLVESSGSAVMRIIVRTPTTSFVTTLKSSGGSGESSLVWGQGQWGLATWAGRALQQYIAALPAQGLIANTFSIELNALTSDGIGIVPPLTIQFRETNRFLGD